MILPINPFSQNNTTLSFKYKHPLKNLWRKGLLPSVTKGIYGDKLTQDTVSLEHLIPHCNKGGTRYENLALASKVKNNARGNSDIRNFLTPEMAQSYLDQFKDIKIQDMFFGDTYIRGIKRTLEKLGINLS